MREKIRSIEKEINRCERDPRFQDDVPKLQNQKAELERQQRTVSLQVSQNISKVSTSICSMSGVGFF